MRKYIVLLVAMASLIFSSGLGFAQSYMLESYNKPGYFIRHFAFKGILAKVENAQDKRDAVFWGKPGLTGHNISFESYNFPGYYLKHWDWKLGLEKDDGSEEFKKHATFKGTKYGNLGYVFEAVNWPGHFLRHKDFKIVLEKSDGSAQFVSDSIFKMQSSGPVEKEPSPPPPPPPNPPTPSPPPADQATAAVDTTVYQRKGEDDEDTNQYLYAGDVVTIVSCDSNWCRISSPYSGWVWGEDLNH